MQFNSTKFKEIIFIAISFISALVFWYFLKHLIYAEFLLDRFILVILIFVLFSVSFLVSLILLKNKYLFLLNSFLIISPILLFFKLNIIYFVLIIFVILILFFGFLSQNVKISKYQAIDFYDLAKKPLVYFLNSIILIILVIFYYSPFIQNIEQFQLPRFLSDAILKFSQPIVQSYLPAFNFEKSAEESIVNFYIQSTGLEKEFSKIKYQDLIKMPQIKNLIKEQKNLLEKQIGVKIKENESFGDVIYRFINNKIQEFARQNPLYFKLSIILILFSFIKLLILPIKYLILILILLVFKLFLLLKIIKIEKQMAEKEILVI